MVDASLSRSVTQINRETLRSRVYAELKAAILKGKFSPGQALTVRGLADAFGTSPTPVREALQQVLAERALEGHPNKSYRIPVISREHFIDLKEVRAAIEGIAAERAAERITPDEIKKLERGNEAMVKSIERQDCKAYLAQNESFHFAVYRAARSPVLLQTIEGLWTQIGPYLNYLFADIKLVESLTTYHVAVIEALQRKDGPAARRAMKHDILTAGAFVEQQTEQADD